MSIGEAIERFENACRKLEDAIDKMEVKDILDNVHEEMADVYIMIEQLIHLIDPDYEMVGWMEHKVSRQEDRIRNEVQKGGQDKAEGQAQ